MSPLLSNIALAVLDEHIAQRPGGPNSSPGVKAGRLRRGLPNFKLVRYAGDWCLMIRGTQSDAVTLRDAIAGVLSTMGLRLSPDKTLITHIVLLTELGTTFQQLIRHVDGVAASFPA